ncbi:hypothetical protein JZX86_25580 [Agrobacterium rosae]|nr:hypothetical protein [Agrobacterium rosae]MBN7808706.1 hypothetical protein [Agrobacterium rosae]
MRTNRDVRSIFTERLQMHANQVEQILGNGDNRRLLADVAVMEGFVPRMS